MVGLFLVVRRKQQQKKESIATPTENLLIPRIRQLMDEQSPYLNSELKLQDIASLLGTNSRYVSDSIKQVESHEADALPLTDETKIN